MGVVPVNQPLYALVSRFEEEVRTNASKEERDVGVQLLIHFSGLNASLQCQWCATEQRLLKFQEGRFNSQQLVQSCAACRRKGELQREAGQATDGATSRMVCATDRGHRRCSYPWWQHLEGQRAEKRPLCAWAAKDRSEAARASSAGGPKTSWQSCPSKKHTHLIMLTCSYCATRIIKRKCVVWSIPGKLFGFSNFTPGCSLSAGQVYFLSTSYEIFNMDFF